MKLWPRRLRAGHARVLGLDDGYRRRIDARRAAATRLVAPASPAAERISTAPPGYLLAHDTADIARHCELLSRLPAPGEVRVVATPGPAPAEWHLDVATRDQPGLLAAFTGVLAARRLDVRQAVVATWDDGGALQAFVLGSAMCPDVGALRGELVASLDEPLSSGPIEDADVVFDDRASPLYTRGDVAAADRPGLLHAIAVAMAAAGADIHAASVSTREGGALDRFDLTDRAHDKLDEPLMTAIRSHIRSGVTARSDGRRLASGGRRRGRRRAS